LGLRLSLLPTPRPLTSRGPSLSGIGWTSLGSALAKLKRFGEAKDAARQAAKQAPDYGPAWALLGKLYSEESRYAEAADAFQKAAQLMPKDAEFWRSLAESYTKMNEPAKSQEAIQKSQEITGNAPIARASSVPLERDRYTDLITVTLRATERRDIDTLMSTYADKVVYRGYGVVDKPFIRKDLESYFRRVASDKGSAKWRGPSSQYEKTTRKETAIFVRFPRYITGSGSRLNRFDIERVVGLGNAGCP
jgi:tetratricopeptide (TPR) repeat protein